MLKFQYQFDESHPLIEVTMPSDSALPEVFEAFQGFLQAAGYSFKDNEILDIVVVDPVVHDSSEVN